MNIFESVFDLAEKFMQNPKFVEIDWNAINKVADNISKQQPKKFREECSRFNETDVAIQLVGGAINYCYWYGSHDIRSNGSSASKMFEVVSYSSSEFSENFIKNLRKNLVVERFPLVEERIKHSSEVLSNINPFLDELRQSDKNGPIDSLASKLVTLYPGYGSDMFLKRASLFFLMLERFFGWFRAATRGLPVAADYQVPKALRAEGCIVYTSDLLNRVMNGVLIPKGSREECEIRAATIITCREIQKLTGWSISDVDGWFWLQRDEYKDPFHLTITTDY